ncbi:MAG: chemotaxis response regulator protein-glutamate methylesterase [Phycisphaerales bacterium]|nr:chemotaxis response regulator protein-glutamate methylesterase [Phycisphaerales bacterium]
MARANEAVKVLLVDDSPMVRSIFQRVLSTYPDIQVVGEAKDPYEARELIIKHRPNVIILDIEMPRMDGLTFLKKLHAHYPVPVIMCSGLTRENSRLALEAMAAGAVDVVAKPNSGGSAALKLLGEDLAEKIHAAAVASSPAPVVPGSAAAPTGGPKSFRDAGINPARYLVMIGASTGGTEAVNLLLQNTPADFPPVAIVQHMPEGFTKSFAERLNSHSQMTVSEAVDGDELVVGRAFVARGGIQMSMVSRAGKYILRYGTSEPVNRHCPAVDVLFDSVAKTAARRTVGIILTGMGADGARGLLNLREAGAITTIAQTEKSCVVYGMPKVAVELGGAVQQGAPAEIPGMVLAALKKHSSASRAGAAV